MPERIFAWPTGEHEKIRMRIARHQKLDEIIQGIGWNIEKGTGCAIGCSLDEYDHAEYARVLGVPLTIAYLIEAIHEALLPELSLAWPGRVTNALQPGVETTHAWSRFAIWLLREFPTYEVSDRVIQLYQRRIANDEPAKEEWKLALDTTGLKREIVRRPTIEIEMRGAMARAIERMASSGARTEEIGIASAWAAIDATKTMMRWIRPRRQANALIEILSTSA